MRRGMRAAERQGGVWRRATLGVALALAALAAGAPRASAICNVIPGANERFRGALGSLDRPFATPGEFVRVSLDPFGCDGGSPGFVDLPGGSVPEDDYAVTVVFTPPSGRRNAVVVARSCAAFAAKVVACDVQLGAGAAVCVPSGADGLDVTSPTALSFRFPDTDAFVGAASDGNGLTGPATVAVTRASDALPCGLGASGQRCATTSTGVVACVDDLFSDGAGACSEAGVDPVFGSFTALPPFNDFEAMVNAPGATPVRFTIDRAGNALVPMDWQRVLVRVNGTPYPRLVSGFTTITAFAGLAGGIRIPGTTALGAFAPNGIRVSPLFTPLLAPNALFDSLFGTVDAPLGVTRVARRLPVLNRCTTPANVRGTACITQEQCGGADRCLPLATPEYQACGGGTNDGLSCLLAEDCPGGSCDPTVCRTGPFVGAPCATDAQCSGGECGPQLFDFAGRLVPDNGTTPVVGVGPVVLGPGGSGSYDVQSIGITTLDGQRTTPRLLALVQPESLEGSDRNGDGDAEDPTVSVMDRTTGQLLSLGYAYPGRAITRITRPPLRGTALDAEDDVVAFLEPEAFAGAPFTDMTYDGDTLDHVLRVGGPGIEFNATSFLDEPADPTPVVNGGAVAVSDALVFFRTAELDSALTRTEVVSVDDGGYQGFGESGSPSASADGRFVAMETRAPLAYPDTDGYADIVVRDRCVSGAFVVPSCSPYTEIASIDDQYVKGNDHSFDPRLSRDGRFVLFRSLADNLDVTISDTNGAWDLFVRDRCVSNGVYLFGCYPTTRRVNLTSAGGEIPYFGFDSTHTLSPDGRYVTFESDVNGIVAGDSDGYNDLFLVDRDSDGDGLYDEPGTYSIGRVNLDSGQKSIPLAYFLYGGRLARSVSNDGRFALFSDDASARLWTSDRCLSFGLGTPPCIPGSAPVDLAPPGAPPAGVQGGWAFSADGRRVAAASGFAIPGSSYVRDLDQDGSVRFDVATPDDDGTGPATKSFDVTLSGDGRFVSFASSDPGLVPYDTQYADDAFVHDVLTGTTTRTSVATGGYEANGFSRRPWISDDGLSVAFESYAMNLVPGGDANGDMSDVFVRRYVGEDCYGDQNGDCLLRDHVLRVFDARAPFLYPIVLGAAREVAVAAGNTAFLDETTWLVRWWENRQGAAPVSLGRKAGAVRLSATTIAALVSERLQDANYDGPPHSDDTDQDDWVVQVSRTAAPDVWLNTGQASRPGLPFAAVNDFVGFLASEREQGTKGTDYTGDGDTVDLAPRLLDASSSALVDLRDGAGNLQPARNFVLGSEAFAFRVNEADRCHVPGSVVTPATCAPPAGCALAQCDLNGDGDCCDDLLFAKDLGLGGPAKNSQRNVVDCALPACDPRTPFRVKGVTIRFLEPELGRDLNGNADLDELLVRVWNLRTGAVDTLGAVDPNAPGTGGFAPSGDPLADDPDPSGAGGAVLGGYGRCVAPRAGSSCNVSTGGGCQSGEFCNGGVCAREHGTCRSVADCPPAAGIACVPDAVVATVSDTDGDSVVDPFDPAPSAPDPALGPCTTAPDLDGDQRLGACDNCPTVSNGKQEDRGGVGTGSAPDGIGDECQCGDVNGDGRVTATDSVLITRSLLTPPTATLARRELCDVNGDDRCSATDAVIVRRALLQPATASILNVCR